MEMFSVYMQQCEVFWWNHGRTRSDSQGIIWPHTTILETCPSAWNILSKCDMKTCENSGCYTPRNKYFDNKIWDHISYMSALDVGSTCIYVYYVYSRIGYIHSSRNSLQKVFSWQRCPPLRSSRWYAPRPVPFGECQWADGRGGQPRFGWRCGGGIARCHRGCNTWGMTGVKIDDTTFNR